MKSKGGSVSDLSVSEVKATLKSVCKDGPRSGSPVYHGKSSTFSSGKGVGGFKEKKG